LIADEIVVKRRITLRDRFQRIIKINDNFIEREFIFHKYAVSRQVLNPFLNSTTRLTNL